MTSILCKLWLGLHDIVQALPKTLWCPLLVGNHCIQQAQCIRRVSAAQTRFQQQMYNMVRAFNRL